MSFKWEEEWVEVSTLFLVAIGFIISILLRNPVLSFISVLLAGGLAGRVVYYKMHKQPILPYILMMIGFLLGYLIGAFWVDRVWTLILFVVGFAVSYYLHEHKIIGMFKSEGYIK